jgi:hypothetical protein
MPKFLNNFFSKKYETSFPITIGKIFDFLF